LASKYCLSDLVKISNIKYQITQNMKTTKQFIALLIALLLAPATFAGQGSGKIKQIIAHDGGIVMFTTENHANKPACSGVAWAFSLNDESGRAMYQLLLLAQAQSKSINVHGYGDCADWGDRERPQFIVISN
jgi:hypothetical protein